MSKYKFIATTLYGLEDVLKAEIEACGAEDIRILNRAVEFSGSIAIMYKLNLSLRTALRILMHLKSFRVENEDQLYRELMKIEWESLFNVHSSIAVTPVINSQLFRHSRYLAQKVKDAIADRFRRATGSRPSVNLKDPDIIVNIHIDNTKADISLDSSGAPLFKRGYRTVAHQASLNEVLAAGMIKLAGWNHKDICLYDPMCGAGTIAIEAAMAGSDIYPGYFRKSYAFFNWNNYDENLFIAVKNRLSHQSLKQCSVYASDISPEAICMTRSNIEKAGLKDVIRLNTVDFFDSLPPESNGLIIMNPPYGERLPKSDINQLYKKIGDTLKMRYAGYESWVISPNFEALKYIGLHPDKKISLMNGDLKCRYQKFAIYEGSRKRKL